MNYSKYLILSDYDGTINIKGQPVSQANIEAVDKFISSGGRFGLATGRGYSDIKQFAEGIQINAPSILCNGALIMDINNKKIIRKCTLDKDIFYLIEDICKWHIDIIVRVYCLEQCYTVYKPDCVDNIMRAIAKAWKVSQQNSRCQRFVREMQDNYLPFAELKDEIFKVLILGSPENMTEIKRYISRSCGPFQYSITSSSVINIEINTYNVNKGQAGLYIKNEFYKRESIILICVGDAENDICALEASDYGFVPYCASPLVKRCADYILSPGNDVIWQIINCIDAGFPSN